MVRRPHLSEMPPGHVVMAGWHLHSKARRSTRPVCRVTLTPEPPIFTTVRHAPRSSSRDCDMCPRQPEAPHHTGCGLRPSQVVRRARVLPMLARHCPAGGQPFVVCRLNRKTYALEEICRQDAAFENTRHLRAVGAARTPRSITPQRITARRDQLASFRHMSERPTGPWRGVEVCIQDD